MRRDPRSLREESLWLHAEEVLIASQREESLCPTSLHPGTKTKTPMISLTGVFKISF